MSLLQEGQRQRSTIGRKLHSGLSIEPDTNPLGLLHNMYAAFRQVDTSSYIVRNHEGNILFRGQLPEEILNFTNLTIEQLIANKTRCKIMECEEALADLSCF